MGIFVMGGAQINGPLKFRRHFDPEDFLRSLELAAGFAYMQLRGLSAWDKYNSEVLYQSVFAGKGCPERSAERVSRLSQPEIGCVQQHDAEGC